MYGRTTSLKTNYMIDNKEVQEYLKKIKKTDPKDAKNWKDAFNSKGAVNNKQEYFELLVDFINKEKNFGTLAQEYSNTFQGQVSRIKGYWEILRADLLGIDRETGEIKAGSLFDSVKKGLGNLQEWLKKSDTQNMLQKIGQGLGEASKSILDAFNYLLDHVDWKELGNIIERIGKSIGKIVKDLSTNKAFMDMIDKLPDLIERILGSKAVEATSDAITAKDTANKSWVGAGLDWIHGKMEKTQVELGTTKTNRAMNDNTEYANYSTWQKIADMIGINPNFQWGSLNPDDNLTKANAWQALVEDDKLTDSQRYRVKDMIDDSNQATYNITIHEIKADNFDQIVDSIQKAQANQK